MNDTAQIMNATPPGDEATCVALSALNRGYRAPNPVANPTRPKLMKKIAAGVTTFRNGSTPSDWLAAIVSVSLNSSTGTRPIQNLDQRKSRNEIGALRIIQKAAPSTDTAGNTKRTATVAITNPASPRFRKAYTFLITPLMYGMRSRSKTLKLYRYTTASATRSSSCDHCVTSRRNTFMSLMNRCRRTVESGNSSARRSSPFNRVNRALRASCDLL